MKISSRICEGGDGAKRKISSTLDASLREERQYESLNLHAHLEARVWEAVDREAVMYTHVTLRLEIR